MHEHAVIQAAPFCIGEKIGEEKVFEPDQISLDVARVDFNVSKDSIEATCTIGAQARTGVEMEALVGVSIALNTIWDVVKYLEKNEDGQYPATKIANIRVLKKIKKI